MTPSEIQTRIKNINPNIKINVTNLPDGKSLNNLLVDGNIKSINDILHVPNQIKNDEPPTNKMEIIFPNKIKKKVVKEPEQTDPNIQIISDQHITFFGQEATYHSRGRLSHDATTLKILLVVQDKFHGRQFRFRIDLYDRAHVQKICNELSDTEGYESAKMEIELEKFTTFLENLRDEQMTPVTKKQVTEAPDRNLNHQALELLQDPNLLSKIDSLIEMAGVIGEQKTRLGLFVMASTYKLKQPLHVLIQGASGSGKSHLLNTIAELFPPEDVLSLTRVSSKSLYHYGENELMNKLVLVQDYDGLNDEAQFAFREIQSAGKLSCSVTRKDRFGNLKAEIKFVEAHFSSIIATTKPEVNNDNMNRSVNVGIDESDEQTLRINLHQNKLTAGMIDQDQIEQARELLRCIIRQLSSKQVVNHYADKVMLPASAKSLRRLNNQFLSLVAQVTLLHQFQRREDEKGRLVATQDDLKKAVELFTEAIYLKVDELDPSTRQFFEHLKKFVKSQTNGSTSKFTLRDIRLASHTNKSQVFRFMETLKNLEYLSIVEGTANRGYKYQITYWDDADKMRAEIKTKLAEQISQIEEPELLNT